MKKTLLFFLLCMGMLSARAQWINGISILPPNPTSADTLRFYVDCSFPNGPCDLDQQLASPSGNDIYAYARHCMGMLTVICSAVDSFIIPPQPPGTYTFRFSLDAGLAPAPCTPSIVPGPSDTLVFVIASPSGLPEPPVDGYSLSCNPRTGVLTISLPKQLAPGDLHIYAADGRWLMKKTLPANTSTWALDLPPGIYLAHLQSGEGHPSKFVITR